MKLSVLLLLVSFLSLAANAQREDIAPKALVSDQSHIVTYEVRGGNVIFTLESIRDFTDDTQSSEGFWKKDFAAFNLDMNDNNLVDSRTDRAFGLRNGTTEICPQFLYDGRSSSACCRLLTKAEVSVSFRGTAKEANPHPVYEFTVPRSELVSETGSIGIVFRFHTAGSGYAYYPQKEKGEPYSSFKNTFKLEL